ncbi:NADH-quinone oxidoreductase subunit 5 family protein [Chryseolinea lacunae]|uniref:NADH-quinone oxidoreductase subunit L n=1 Tax=Chryseolinea lacunae TaxID=2801331 RepID=A0ABS1KSY5_9BACT|nr:NADH-quinone oxidoreductase subunit L [Chryseolinea lacunae]MBL0742541.1 NADH-quinone oxidoreductase subunit L [Chryseolinea lacunae]
MDTLQAHSSFFVICLGGALALPLLSFLLCFYVSEKYSWATSVLAPFLMMASTVCAAVVLYQAWNHPAFTWQRVWFSIADHTFTAGIHVNNASALMLFVVTGVSFLVHVYSIGYMAGDTALRRYFAMLGFFTFSMLGIVVSDNLLLIFVFWELVGFSSYMLIGHWNESPAAAEASKRAFIINRVGDAGFLIGLMLVWTHGHTFNIEALRALPLDPAWMTAASLCIFCGVVGKSAQFPLFTWLPDAMEGPTPVSALIHAATMVTAGVFLLGRAHFLFTPAALNVVAITGAITALLGAFAALSQHDIKKVLAYSTMSQLGLMVAAMGAGAPEAALLHLFTHAFFKACLFLSAGSIIHALHQAQHQSHVNFDVQDIRLLGGLRKKLPFTFIMFVVSGSALAGLPLFSGFLSKDAILAALVHWSNTGDAWHWVVLLVVALVSFVTVLYTFRLVWTIFNGEEKSTASLVVSEPPVVMRAPMAVLALASVWIWFSWNPFSFSGWIYNHIGAAKDFHGGFVSMASAAWVLLALAVAYASRGRKLDSRLLAQGFYVDLFSRKAIEQPTLQLADLTHRADKKWIDGFLHATAYAQVIVANLTGWFDRAIVDGFVDGAAGLAKSIGSFTRSFQGGKIQLYIFWAAFAIIIFIIWTLL